MNTNEKGVWTQESKERHPVCFPHLPGPENTRSHPDTHAESHRATHFHTLPHAWCLRLGQSPRAPHLSSPRSPAPHSDSPCSELGPLSRPRPLWAQPWTCGLSAAACTPLPLNLTPPPLPRFVLFPPPPFCLSPTSESHYGKLRHQSGHPPSCPWLQVLEKPSGPGDTPWPIHRWRPAPSRNFQPPIPRLFRRLQHSQGS